MKSAALIHFFMILSLSGLVPIFSLLFQFLLVGFHYWRSHYSKCEPCTPRTAIIIPAWNEADSVSATIEQLMRLDYPSDAFRIYLIDDASTDNTFELCKEKQLAYPNKIIYAKREQGGLGKAHVLNFGLQLVLSDEWAEAVLMIDADVLFSPTSLTRMTRHLADPTVGAVTAYIREGHVPGNLVSHFIATEYVISQAGARRSQNVMGWLACLAGGAQLHTRENIIALGGKINTTTLAEDTYTTFLTQLDGRLAIFEGNAIARAEEPGNLRSLWKQRFRWARGNVQITRAFRHIWFHPKKEASLGSVLFGWIWFSTLFMPFFMILTSISLIVLLFLDVNLSWKIFQSFSALSIVCYLFFTFYTLFIDFEVTKRAWIATLMFPGFISLTIMIFSFAPHTFNYVLKMISTTHTFIYWRMNILLFFYAWISVCMLFAWFVYRLDKAGLSQKITDFLLIIVGYGPFLCVITLSSFIAEMVQINLKWDKTERLKMKETVFISEAKSSFEKLLTRDKWFEKRLFIYEVIIIFLIIFLLILRNYSEF